MKKIIVSFLVGLVVGAAAGILIPRWAEPHLPPALRVDESVTEGTVVAKQRRDDQLLLTVDTAEGAVLATFHQQLDEIALLVEEGDTVGLGLRRYEPFAEDPPIRKVVKPRQAPRVEAERPGVEDAEPAAETAPPGVVEAGAGRPVEDTGDAPDAAGVPEGEGGSSGGAESSSEGPPPEHL